MSAAVPVLPSEQPPESIRSSNTSKGDQEKDCYEESNVSPAAFVAANAGRGSNGTFVEHDDDAPTNGLAAVSWKWKLAALLCVIFLSSE